ncbi:MAG: aminodeoxychorismate/anthranilate synthase component II [Firmicutes bacterium HGW-Firmicutes-1]|jgi:anthranilate synthase component 2|nr:MAG: aminodeoxychorismate/anthranilate synthase component II [Firmicutes bacterium HGW-Firmicutes-1]
MILLIDNYDSFTYNLYQFIGEYDDQIVVYRNDEITGKEILEMKPDKVVISPGPKAPKEAGNCLEIIKQVAGIIPILGICLGHQCIGEAFGGNIVHAKTLFHGKSSVIHLEKDKLFKGIDEELTVARYHSLVVEYESIPDCFEILSISDDDEIMAMKHKDYEIYGLQFHPESVLTQNGKKIIENFIL